MHLIIDGYNLIRQCPDLSRLDQQDLQSGRDALIDRLRAYKRHRPHRITVVFDGIGDPYLQRNRDRIGGITIIYSHAGETADQVISRIVAGDGPEAVVVSSDRAVMTDAQRRGAAAIPAPEFAGRLEMAVAMDPNAESPPPSDGWTPTTKKRGPHRRRSKKQRREQRRIRKL